MKNIFLLLLLANLLVLAWETWVVDPARDLNITRIDDGTPSLVYLTPRGTPAVGSSASSGESVSMSSSSPDIAMRCLRVGPFANQAAADSARSDLAGRIAEVETRAIEGDVWVGHWVQIRDLPARSRAREVLANLKANGIGDAYIVPTETAYKISMGVFRDRSGANTIARRARRLGYDVDVSDRFRPGTIYWLDMRVGAGQDPDIRSLQSDGDRTIIRAESFECVESGSAPDLPIGDDGAAAA